MGEGMVEGGRKEWDGKMVEKERRRKAGREGRRKEKEESP